MLVGILHSSCVHPLHAQKIDQGAQYRLHRGTPALDQEAGVVFVSVQLLVHLVIERLMDAHLYLLELRGPAAAFQS